MPMIFSNVKLNWFVRTFNWFRNDATWKFKIFNKLKKCCVKDKQRQAVLKNPKQSISHQYICISHIYSPNITIINVHFLKNNIFIVVFKRCSSFCHILKILKTNENTIEIELFSNQTNSCVVFCSTTHVPFVDFACCASHAAQRRTVVVRRTCELRLYTHALNSIHKYKYCLEHVNNNIPRCCTRCRARRRALAPTASTSCRLRARSVQSQDACRPRTSRSVVVCASRGSRADRRQCLWRHRSEAVWSVCHCCFSQAHSMA